MSGLRVLIDRLTI